MAIDRGIKASTVRNCVEKALKLDVSIIDIGDQYYCVPSHSRPGHGYLVEVDDDGRSYCDCEGNTHTGYCWHRAAVGLKLGVIPPQFLPITAETAPLVLSDYQRQGGRMSLYGPESVA